MQQTALPGFAVDLFTLEPVRPSYVKMVRQLEGVARDRGVPVALLGEADLVAHAQLKGWSAATLVNLTRVAAAHGLPVDPHRSQRVVTRPDGLLLSSVMVTDRGRPAGQQRVAMLAGVSWWCPAPMEWWRQRRFGDLTVAGGDVVVRVSDRDPIRCPGVAATFEVWAATVRTLHPTTDVDQLPVLARLDGASTRPAGSRTMQSDWAEWCPQVTFDRWRAWAVDAGATPVGRGVRRPQHR